MTPGTSQWTLSYQLSPIIFCGGIAQNMPGGVLPIISITEGTSFNAGVVNSGGPLDLSDYFANFAPLPGATVGENSIGEYPFANQAVAGNAIIAQPTILSMLMVCPARQPGGYAQVQAVFSALVSAMKQHDSLGGTYTVVTPKYPFTDGIHLRTVDVSSNDSKQPQSAWQMDFRFPLLTLESAQQAQNTLMSKLSNGTQINGQPNYSGGATSVGQPSSLAGTSLPAGGSIAGTNTAPLPLPPPAPGPAPALTLNT